MKVFGKLRATALVSLLAVPFSGFAAESDVFMNGQSIYGQPYAQGSAARVVDVGAADQVTVSPGESITFRSGANQFSWTFNGLVDRRSVELAKIAPAGFTAKPFTVYVSRSTNPNFR